MTYGRAFDVGHVNQVEDAAVSHGLTSSPPRGGRALIALPLLYARLRLSSLVASETNS